MDIVYSIPLNAEFRFVHEPLEGSSDAHQRRFVGREDELSELAGRLVLSDGGAFLITGYRGVGKSTFVNRVIKQVEQRLAGSQELVGPVELVDVHLNVPRQMESVELMFHILRGLYSRLEDKKILQALDAHLREDLQLAFLRTSRSLAIKNAIGLEGSAGVAIGAALPLDGGSSKISFSSKRTRSESREMKYLAYDDKAAEYDLIQIARRLTNGYQPMRSRWQTLVDCVSRHERSRKKLKVVFVFDELDKIEDVRDGAEPGIDAILANLKTLFTTSGICFVFVAGRGTHDRWIEDLGLGDSIYESVFSYARYLQPMWAHADHICDPFLDNNAFGSVKATELAATYASFKKFLAFNGRGIPRRMLRKFNERVRWDGTRPALGFSPDDVRQFRFFADLQDLLDSRQRELLGELQDDGFSGRADRQRLALYYLVDWILLRGFDEFELADAVSASRRLSRLIAPGEQAAPQLAGRLLTLLCDYQYLETAKIDKTGHGSGSPHPTANTPARYRLTRKRLIEMGSLAGVLEPEAPAVASEDRAKKFGGRYDVRSVIARGGMSTVYLAEDHRFNRTVAIKEQLSETVDDARVSQRFRHEAEVLSHLAHENVVHIYDADLDAKPAYIVLEHVEGFRLMDLIARHALSGDGIALKIARDLVRALAHVHQRGVLWLDSKPSNVLVTAHGRIVLLDFGIAGSTRRPNNEAGIVLGTPAYSSPEQLRNETLDERSDIYSIGIVLYQMFTGRLPFDGDPTAIGTALKRFTEAPVPPSSIAKVPRAVEDAILKCLEVERDKRFPTAQALLDALPEGASQAAFMQALGEALQSAPAASIAGMMPPREEEGVAREHDTVIRSVPLMFIPPPPPSPRASGAGLAGATSSAPAQGPATVTMVPTARSVSPTPGSVAAPQFTVTPTLPPDVAPPVSEPVSLMPPSFARLVLPSGETRPLEGAQTIKIGRSDQNQIRIFDPRASRYHALLQKSREGWTVVDQNSRFGTRVNGIPVTAPRLLREGDIVAIGETELTYTEVPPDNVEAAPSAARVRHRDLQELLEDVRRLAATGSIEDLLNGVLDSAIQLAQAERGFVMLANEGQPLEFKAARARGGVPLPGKAFSTSRKIPDEVFESGVERIVTDLLEGDIGELHKGTVALGIRHAFCLPMKTPNRLRPVGVVYLDSRERGVLPAADLRSRLQILVAAAADAIETMSLRDADRDRRSLEQELLRAAAVQTALVQPLEDQSSEFYAVAFRLAPRRLGGESVNVVRPSDHSIAIVLLDVAGRGTVPALIGAYINGIVSASVHLANPSLLLAEINRAMLSRSLESRFAVMFYGILTPDGKFVYGSAGHTPPLLIKGDGATFLDGVASVPLGLLESAVYEVGSIQLDAGDTIVSTTSDIAEATNPNGDEFGMERIRQIVNEVRDREPGVIADAVVNGMQTFAGNVASNLEGAVAVLRYVQGGTLS